MKLHHSKIPSILATSPIAKPIASNRGRKHTIDDPDHTGGPAKQVRLSGAQSDGNHKKIRNVINTAPQDLMDLYVCGRGEHGELGLGRSILSLNTPGPITSLTGHNRDIVSVACGIRHVLALTIDGRVLSWGSNEEGSLGRDTTWHDANLDLDLPLDTLVPPNPFASVPDEVDGFPDDTVITKIAAGDTISLALTDDGHVYGWGSFRNPQGRLGFYPANKTAPSILLQQTPRQYAELAKITDIVCGANHCLALTQAGTIFVWGCCEQNQLGRHVNERLDVESKACLIPTPLRTGRKRFSGIFSGSDHAFAIQVGGGVLSWGANAFGATGVGLDAGVGSNGDDMSTVYVPSAVPALGTDVVSIAAGQNHSLAVTTNGRLLVWGRVDGKQIGIRSQEIASLVESADLTYDATTRLNAEALPRMLLRPTPMPACEGVGEGVLFIAAGLDHSLLITGLGKVSAWGTNGARQTGVDSSADVEVPKLVSGDSWGNRPCIWCGAGAQYSIFAIARKSG